MTAASDVPLWNRLLLITLSLLISLFSSGVIFGFASLKPVLEASGVYRYLCDEGKDSCDAQNLRLNLMFTIGSSAINIASLPVGHVLDVYGPRVSLFVGSLTHLVSCLLFVISYRFSVDLYIPAFLLLAIGGAFIFLSTMHLSASFPKYSILLMAALSCTFDMSSLCFFIFNQLYFGTRGRIGIVGYFSLLTIVSTLAFVVAAFLMPKVSFRMPVAVEKEIAGVGDPLLSECSDIDSRCDTPVETETYADSVAEKFLGLPFKKQILTLPYILLVVFMCFFVLRLNFYIGTLQSQLLNFASGGQAIDKYTAAFSLCLPIGPIIAIFVSNFLLGQSFRVAYSTLYVMQIVFGIIIMIPSLDLQYAAFVLFVVMRSITYAFSNQFCAKIFGFETFGRMYGFMMLAAGIFNSIQYLLTWITTTYLDSNYLAANIFIFAGCIVLGALLPAFTFYHRL